jgi:hypothetical protein
MYKPTDFIPPVSLTVERYPSFQSTAFRDIPSNERVALGSLKKSNCELLI